MYVNFQMTCYRSKPCCPTKVSEGVTILGVRWMIHGHLGVVLKRSYTENDTVLFTSFTHNTYMYKSGTCFPYHPRSSLTPWAEGGNLCLAQNYPRPRTLSSCPSCVNLMSTETLISFYKHFTSKEEKMKLNSSIQTNLKPFKLMESMAQHFRFVFL